MSDNLPQSLWAAGDHTTLTDQQFAGLLSTFRADSRNSGNFTVSLVRTAWAVTVWPGTPRFNATLTYDDQSKRFYVQSSQAVQDAGTYELLGAVVDGLGVTDLSGESVNNFHNRKPVELHIRFQTGTLAAVTHELLPSPPS